MCKQSRRPKPPQPTETLAAAASSIPTIPSPACPRELSSELRVVFAMTPVPFSLSFSFCFAYFISPSFTGSSRPRRQAVLHPRVVTVLSVGLGENPLAPAFVWYRSLGKSCPKTLKPRTPVRTSPAFMVRRRARRQLRPETPFNRTILSQPSKRDPTAEVRRYRSVNLQNRPWQFCLRTLCGKEPLHLSPAFLRIRPLR